MTEHVILFLATNPYGSSERALRAGCGLTPRRAADRVVAPDPALLWIPATPRSKEPSLLHTRLANAHLHDEDPKP